MRKGLAFGKFMPLHHGHQLVIDRALAECDDVTVVVYDSKPPGDYPPMPVKMRMGWVNELYPQIKSLVSLPDIVPEGQDGPEWAEICAAQVSDLGPFDRVYTSEPDYDCFANVLEASHVVVDTERGLVPISGTAIRKDPYANRGMMDARVYKDLIQKIVFVGTESSGKTTLACELAEQFDTLWVHEYGRELWEAQSLTGHFDDMLKIGKTQYAREEAGVREANAYLFCDTNAWTTLQWSIWAYLVADHRLHELVDRTAHEYIWIVCANDFGWVQDGTREMPGELSGRFQQQQLDDLTRRGIAHYVVSGSLNERVERVKEIIKIERRSHDR